MPAGLQLALMVQSGSRWHDTNSGIQGSSHGWHFSSLCFSLLSQHTHNGMITTTIVRLFGSVCRMYVCMYVCVHVCMYVCVYACMSACHIECCFMLKVFLFSPETEA